MTVVTGKYKSKESYVGSWLFI